MRLNNSSSSSRSSFPSITCSSIFTRRSTSSRIPSSNSLSRLRRPAMTVTSSFVGRHRFERCQALLELHGLQYLSLGLEASEFDIEELSRHGGVRPVQLAAENLICHLLQLNLDIGDIGDWTALAATAPAPAAVCGAPICEVGMVHIAPLLAAHRLCPTAITARLDESANGHLGSTPSPTRKLDSRYVVLGGEPSVHPRRVRVIALPLLAALSCALAVVGADALSPHGMPLTLGTRELYTRTEYTQGLPVSILQSSSDPLQ